MMIIIIIIIAIYKVNIIGPIPKKRYQSKYTSEMTYEII